MEISIKRYNQTGVIIPVRTKYTSVRFYLKIRARVSTYSMLKVVVVLQQYHLVSPISSRTLATYIQEVDFY